MNGGRISFREIKRWFLTFPNDKQRLTGRLHSIFIILILSCICLALVLTPQSITNRISEPSVETYEQHVDQHFDFLQCPCDQTSIQYKLYL